MKLLYKNIIINSLASLLINFLGGVITYFFIVTKIQQESYEHLSNEKTTVEEKLKNGLQPNQLQNNIGDEIIIKEISALSNKKPFFTTISKLEEANEEYE